MFDIFAGECVEIFPALLFNIKYMRVLLNIFYSDVLDPLMQMDGFLMLELELGFFFTFISSMYAPSGQARILGRRVSHL